MTTTATRSLGSALGPNGSGVTTTPMFPTLCPGQGQTEAERRPSRLHRLELHRSANRTSMENLCPIEDLGLGACKCGRACLFNAKPSDLRYFRSKLGEAMRSGASEKMFEVVQQILITYEDICTASPVQYHALKGGIIHMTRHLACYWAKDGVRVNCLSPGPFPSEKAPTEMVARLKSKLPMQRMKLQCKLMCK